MSKSYFYTNIIFFWMHTHYGRVIFSFLKFKIVQVNFLVCSVPLFFYLNCLANVRLECPFIHTCEDTMSWKGKFCITYPCDDLLSTSSNDSDEVCSVIYQHLLCFKSSNNKSFLKSNIHFGWLLYWNQNFGR